MMSAFSPHEKVTFSTVEVYMGAYLPRCCLKSKKYDKLDQAAEKIEEILEMKHLHAALTKSESRKAQALKARKISMPERSPEELKEIGAFNVKVKSK